MTDQAALDDAARAGFELGVFEDGGDDDNASVVEEFFPRIEGGAEGGGAVVPSTPASASASALSPAPLPPGKPGLREKLIRRAGNNAGAVS